MAEWSEETKERLEKTMHVTPGLVGDAATVIVRLSDIRAALDEIRRQGKRIEELEGRRAVGDKLASSLDFLEIADSNQKRADRVDTILRDVALALKPAYGDDVHRCTTETLPTWVSEQVQRVEKAEADIRAALDEIRLLNTENESNPVWVRAIESVLMIRCVKHHTVPQYNSEEIHGAECAACEVETLRAVLAQKVEADKADHLAARLHGTLREARVTSERRAEAAEAREAKLREAADWVLHVAHGVGRGGEDPESGEDHAALNALEEAAFPERVKARTALAEGKE